MITVVGAGIVIQKVGITTSVKVDAMISVVTAGIVP
jgi:hypothetical protein